MKKSSKLIFAAISITLFFNVLSVPKAKAQNVLIEILKRIQTNNNYLHSLHSKITLAKYNSQLKEIDVFEGTAIYAKASGNRISLRIDWTKPLAESIYFTNGQYVFYRPHLKQAIVGYIDKTKENVRICNALSFINMSKSEIKANYDIMYLGTETIKGGSKTWHLVITPKKDTSYKSSELWVDGNGMPIQVKVSHANNDSITVLFSEIRKNETINVAAFRPELPKDTKIIKTSPVYFPCIMDDESAKKTLIEIKKDVKINKVRVRRKPVRLRSLKSIRLRKKKRR
jgi:outer membrane lipoprotein-sorting protein